MKIYICIKKNGKLEELKSVEIPSSYIRSGDNDYLESNVIGGGGGNNDIDDLLGRLDLDRIRNNKETYINKTLSDIPSLNMNESISTIEIDEILHK